jgi:UDP-2,4-diacetamido-2,4,6-trideoxy-beta-L-altropyranose hydrolase
MKSFLVVFRVDASVEIGTGHVMRCLTLAEELRRQGHDCRFICRDHRGHLGELIAGKGFPVNLLLTTVEDSLDYSRGYGTAHSEWLGVPWQLDAAQTLSLLESLRVDWLVVDHYALDSRWEGQVNGAVGGIMVIDDLADRDHQADMLLDQNALNEEMEERYRERLNSECTLLLGPHYALLGSEYSFLANALPERNGQVSRALVFVGGSDPHHLTERYLNALSAPEFRNILVDVVLGKNHPAPEAVSDLVSSREHARIYSGLPSLSALMIRADLMLGAGGATNWERMCLGLNSVVVSVAHNQDKVNQELEKKGFIHFLGKAEHVTVDIIRSALKQILVSPLDNCASARSMRKIVDGKGCKRVVETLLGQRKT